VVECGRGAVLDALLGGRVRVDDDKETPAATAAATRRIATPMIATRRR
jgi:hypothetical protein